MNKDQLFDKVKFVKGEKFLTIEDTSQLNNEEIIELISYLNQETDRLSVEIINIMFNQYQEISPKLEKHLTSNGYLLFDEKVTVYMDLSNLAMREYYSHYRSLNEISISEFIEVWEEAMTGSLNAPSTLSAADQMKSVEVELGKSYRESCLVAYEDTNAIGVVMPHIEPGEKDEGRLFYFGLVPSERGKRKRNLLHHDALLLLKTEFNAGYYIGSTSRSNIPMLKTFEANGCKVKDINRLYKKHVKIKN